jgi:plastocyanin
MRSALFAFVLLLTGMSAATADDATVTIKNFSFAMDVTVTSGSTVTWKNLDGEPHTVTSADGLFRSPALDENDGFSFKFDKPGVYKYICSIHPKMRATVTVK